MRINFLIIVIFFLVQQNFAKSTFFRAETDSLPPVFISLSGNSCTLGEEMDLDLEIADQSELAENPVSAYYTVGNDSQVLVDFTPSTGKDSISYSFTAIIPANAVSAAATGTLSLVFKDVHNNQSEPVSKNIYWFNETDPPEFVSLTGDTCIIGNEMFLNLSIKDQSGLSANPVIASYSVGDSESSLNFILQKKVSGERIYNFKGIIPANVTSSVAIGQLELVFSDSLNNLSVPITKNIYWISETIVPEIELHSPVYIAPLAGTRIKAKISDASGISQVYYQYSNDDGTNWTDLIEMSQSGSYYFADFPAQLLGTNIIYKIIAYDAAPEPNENSALGELHWTRDYVINESFESGNVLDRWSIESTNSTTWVRGGSAYYAPQDSLYQMILKKKAENQNEWLKSPPIYTGKFNYLKFWSKTNHGSTAGDHYYVKISKDGGSSWITIWDASSLPAEEISLYEEITIELPDQLIMQEIIIAFQGVSASGLKDDWYLDNISLISDLTEDDDAPIVKEIKGITNEMIGHEMVIDLTIWDRTGFSPDDPVLATYQIEDEDLEEVIFTAVKNQKSSVTQSYTATIPARNIPVSGTLFLYLKDILGTSNQEPYSYTIDWYGDINSPVITLNDLPEFVEPDENLQISATVEDESEVDVEIFYRMEDETDYTTKQMKKSGTNYTYTFPAQNKETRVYFQIVASETSTADLLVSVSEEQSVLWGEYSELTLTPNGWESSLGTDGSSAYSFGLNFETPVDKAFYLRRVEIAGGSTDLLVNWKVVKFDSVPTSQQIGTLSGSFETTGKQENDFTASYFTTLNNSRIYGKFAIIIDVPEVNSPAENFFAVSTTAENGNNSWFNKDGKWQNTANILNSYNCTFYLKALIKSETFTEINELIPEKTNLSQNYPNPFNPLTSIKYSLAEKGQVSLKVYNSKGQMIKKLVDKFCYAGSYNVTFNASEFNSGVFFYRLTTNHENLIKKMVFIK